MDKLITKFLQIEEQSVNETGTIAYMPRSMVLVTLPHRKPEDHVFIRKNGDITFKMIGDPDLGLPYGSYPRLLMAWITREVKIKKSPTIYLGKSFSSLLSELQLCQNGGVRGDATRLREQIFKLFSTHISSIHIDRKLGVCQSEQFMFARSFNLWWDPVKRFGDSISPQSQITLSADFFDELSDRPVPLDFRMYQALRRSPLQMDIYAWLTYRFSYLKKSTLIPWINLKHQFGSNYATTKQGVRDFKREFLRSLHVVSVMYKEANVEVQDDGLLLEKSHSHIKKLSKEGVN